MAADWCWSQLQWYKANYATKCFELWVLNVPLLIDLQDADTATKLLGMQCIEKSVDYIRDGSASASPELLTMLLTNVTTTEAGSERLLQIGKGDLEGFNMCASASCSSGHFPRKLANMFVLCSLMDLRRGRDSTEYCEAYHCRPCVTRSLTLLSESESACFACVS